MGIIIPSKLVVTTIKEVAYHFMTFYNLLFLTNHNCESIGISPGTWKKRMQSSMIPIFFLQINVFYDIIDFCLFFVLFLDEANFG